MTGHPAKHRQRAWHRGQGAERLAAWWLRLKGYRILARQYRTAVGEIDLIARRGTVLAFVEVKARATEAEARAAITTRQRQRITRAADAYLQRTPSLGKLGARFDVVLIVPGCRPQHIVDAWRGGLGGQV